jgi:hypothetical protein
MLAQWLEARFECGYRDAVRFVAVALVREDSDEE